MSKLNTATNIEDFSDDLGNFVAGGLGQDQQFQFRPRSSTNESEWVPVPEDHLFNLEANNYRVAEVRLVVNGDLVMDTREDSGIPISEAKIVVHIARKCHRNKSTVDFGQDEDGNPISRELHVNELGNVAVGCQEYTYEEVMAFAKGQGWKHNGH